MSLISVLTSAATRLPQKVLASLGIGLITFGAVVTAFNSLMTALQANYSGLGSELLALLEIGGVTDGLQILLGAFVAKMTIQTLSKYGYLGGLT
ncbi:MAG: hypothetical protein CMP91_13185 [Gammaproteobacteria bacterium]|mgnify:CR=1 FL=1|nr:hypothetical protein [Gammaproteobacteria bacterium]|tara:strand:- start:9543 stop:9824 length:282 start_codon:yes stop_codon:yes gene_type:complete